jgi:YtxH-like protein
VNQPAKSDLRRVIPCPGPFTTPQGEPASNPEKMRQNDLSVCPLIRVFQLQDSPVAVPWSVLEAQPLFGFNERRFHMADEGRINGFAWFLAGLGIGALTGILYAPKSGRETREDLANSAREGSEYLRNRSKQVAEKVLKRAANKWAIWSTRAVNR